MASYFFFYYTSNYLIVLLVYTTVWDFILGKEIWKASTQRRKKTLLIISLVGNLGLLGFYKYADFAISQFNVLGHYLNFSEQIPLLNLVLPIGISFYTFHSITYTVGIYRGQIQPAKSFLEYAIFVAFFPQLVAGPIIRAKEFLPQLREKIENTEVSSKLRQIVLHSSNLKTGITLMVFGFVKKMFFADNIAPLVDKIFNYPMGSESFTIMLGALAFGVQVYCDFSGYTDIAIGAASILGFKLPTNFNFPYFASSPSDFWRRWHISLSTWLRDYLYIPLGGNRKSRSRTCLNLFIVMFLGGLWHGAAWNFVLWGLIHGSLISTHKFFPNRFLSLSQNRLIKSRIGIVLSIIITQYLIFFAWISFRVKDFDALRYSLEKYVLLDLATSKTIYVITHNLPAVLLVLLFFGLHYISYKKGGVHNIIAEWPLSRWLVFLAASSLLVSFFYNGKPEDFIYFKF